VKLPDRVREEGNRQLQKAEKEFSSVSSTFAGYMDIFSDPRIAKNLEKSTFSLSNFLNERATLYLCVRSSDQGRLKPVISMFFEYAALTFLHEEPAKDDLSVILLLDEFVRLSRMQEMLEMPAISRSYRVNVVFVCQSQVKGIYQQTGLDQLINTCAYRVIFGQNEPDVAESISKSIGHKTRKKRSYSSQSGKMGKNHSKSEEGVPLILAQDVMSLKFGEIILLRQNHFKNPIKAKVPFWFTDSTQKPLITLDE